MGLFDFIGDVVEGALEVAEVVVDTVVETAETVLEDVGKPPSI